MLCNIGVILHKCANIKLYKENEDLERCFDKYLLPLVVRLLVKSTADKKEFPYTRQGYVKSQDMIWLVVIFEKKYKSRSRMQMMSFL